MRWENMTSKLDLGNNIFCLIDDEDFEELSKFRWKLYKCNPRGKPFPTGYYVGRYAKDRDPPTIHIHRQIMESPNSYVDHINGNTLDNRKENLRFASNSLNQLNRHNFKTNKNGYPGVKKTKWGTFEARIRIFGKITHLGTFKKVEKAGRIYEVTRLRLLEEVNGMGSGDSTHVCNLK